MGRVGLQPAHMPRRLEARTRTAEARPLGSVNMERLEASRHLADRHLAEKMRRIEAVLKESECILPDSGDFWTLNDCPFTGDPLGSGSMGGVALGSLQYYDQDGHDLSLVVEDVPGTITYVRVLSGDGKLVTVSGQEMQFVETERGEMLLPMTTVVVWKP